MNFFRQKIFLEFLKKTFFHLIIHLEVGNPSWRNFSWPNPRCSTGFCNFWQSCSDNSMWMIMITVCQNCHFMIAVDHIYTTSSSLWVGFVWIGFTIFNSFRNLLKKKYKLKTAIKSYRDVLLEFHLFWNTTSIGFPAESLL